MAMMEWFAGVGSALASLLLFWWSALDNYAHPVYRFTAWIGKLAFCLSPYVQLTISEYGAERFERSEFFLAVEVYLSDAWAHRARRLKADTVRDSKNLQVSVDGHEEITDTYRGATIWWRASKKKPRQTVISFYPGHGESRFYNVVFHRRHRDLVIHDYLPYVLNEGRAASVRNRPRRLFTNKPSSRWNPYDDDAKKAAWSHVTFQHPATFKTLAMDPKEKQSIVDDLTAFFKAKDYYAKVGKAWKRGYLLYGPPGTGKSTLIAAMANFLDYDVYDLELTAVKNNTELRKLFIETTSKSIIVIEDIDRSVDLIGKRKDRKPAVDRDPSRPPTDPPEEDAEKKMTLSGVLNFIDGLWSACGGERIIVFTTNNKDDLDPALIRRGRMDKHIEMSYCRFETFKVLARNYLDITEHELFGEIQQLLEEVDMSPADVAEHLMPMSSRKDDSPETCLVDLVEALKKAKALAADAKAKAKEKADAAAAEPKEDEEGKKDDVDDDTSDLARANKVVLERAQQAETGASDEWVLDTSSLVHHTFNLQLLQQHDLPSDQTLTAQELLAVVGECGGSVQTERFKLPDVRYIEGETRNVVSVAQLARRHGLVTVFEPTCAYVRDMATGQDVGRAHLSNGIYVLDYLLVQQLNEGSVQAHQRQGQAGGSCGGGGGGRGGIGGSDGGKERKGGDGGGSRGTAGGQGRGGGGGAGEGRDEGREEERDDCGSGGQDGDDEVEELEESSQMQVGIFGQPRSDRVTTAGVFSTSTNELRGQRTKAFYVDSGAEHHVTWNREVLLPYPQQLSISTDIRCITGVSGSCIRVDGIGYVDSNGGSLDRVLFVPDSVVNLVSVSQLCKDYFASVAFYDDKMWIDRIKNRERIGHGNRVGGLYVLDRFEAECLVQQHQMRASL